MVWKNSDNHYFRVKVGGKKFVMVGVSNFAIEQNYNVFFFGEGEGSDSLKKLKDTSKVKVISSEISWEQAESIVLGRELETA